MQINIKSMRAFIYQQMNGINLYIFIKELAEYLKKISFVKE